MESTILVNYYAKEGQDKWVLEKLKNKKNGYFVDIGATNGISNNNTYALEKHFNWKGICVEPNPKLRAFQSLKDNRDCICENLCIYSEAGEVDFLARGRKVETSGIYADCSSMIIRHMVELKKHGLIKVPAITLLELLDKHNAPKVIDYLSIDIEGAEWEVLKNFDFKKYKFLTISVEHNYGKTMAWDEKEKIKGDKILKLLSKNGYVLDKKVAMDYWLVSKDIGDKDIETKFWDGKFKKTIKKYYKISFCTTCMDRLYNLKKTLPVNMKDNENYPNLEFVILNYNSKDKLEQWVKDNLMEHIESGRVSYYKTTEPTEFSMAHSRNIAFKVAQGEIVNNLDADNYTYSSDYSPEEKLASYINRLANQQKEKVIFAKGKRAMHGRIGFYKNEFIDILGGYDEGLLGYGHDDHDLVQRAWRLGFTMSWWGGQYYNRIRTSTIEKNKNMKRHWKETEIENKIKSAKNIEAGIYKANQGKHWGKAKLIKNFCEEIEI